LHICADETGTLAPGGGTSASYAWNTGETTSSIDVSEAGTYTVTKSELGCESDATVLVTQSVGVSLSDIDACEDDGPVSVDATIPDGSSYAWSGGGSNSTAVNTFTTDGSYTVTATDNFGCVSTDGFNLLILGAPVAAINITATTGTSHFFSSANSQEIGANTTYSWLFNSVDTSTQANPSYVFPWSSTPMTYPVTLEVNNGCDVDSKSINVTVDPLGVEETKVANNFSVYPNPANDNVKFALASPASAEGTIKVLDIAGRVLASQTIAAGQIIGDLSLVGIASGSYLVKVSIDGNESVNPIVKQ
jgi:hypothetical protein